MAEEKKKGPMEENKGKGRKETGTQLDRAAVNALRLIVLTIVFTAIVFLVTQGIPRGYEFGYAIFEEGDEDQSSGADMPFTVEEGMSVKEVGEELKAMGLIDDTLVFIAQAKFFEYTIYPGEYTINTSMSSRQILDLLGTPPETETAAS